MKIVLHTDKNETYCSLEHHGIIVFFNRVRETGNSVTLYDDSKQEVGRIVGKSTEIFLKKFNIIEEKALKELALALC